MNQENSDKNTDKGVNDRFSAAQMKYMGLGFEFAGAVIVMTLIGWFVDRQWATEPWGLLIGGVLGIVTGMYVLLKAAVKISSEQDKQDRRK